MKIIFEAVDPEERKLRLRKIVDYARRNNGAFEMTPTWHPHAQTHYFARYDHAASIVGNHKAGRTPKVRRLLTARARLNRLDLRKAQALAIKKTIKKLKIDKSELHKHIVRHAADKLTSTGAWIAMRRYKGLPA